MDGYGDFGNDPRHDSRFHWDMPPLARGLRWTGRRQGRGFSFATGAHPCGGTSPSLRTRRSPKAYYVFFVESGMGAYFVAFDH